MNQAITYTMDDLLYLMQRLRDPQTGCPWDQQQDWQSLPRHTLEETFEVIDAIERQDWPHVQEELGDLLFQIVYYACFAAEEQRFDFAAVVDGLVHKLVRRHPHVFPDGQLRSHRESSKVLALNALNQQWEDTKARERAEKHRAESLLDDVPLALPAMLRAVKLQKRAARVGFDWDAADQVMDKLEEELAEMRAAIRSGKQAEVAAETGDFLFAAVNLARHLQVDPETALRGTNQKFVRRFRFIEQQCKAQGICLEAAGLAQLEAFWQAAKTWE